MISAIDLFCGAGGLTKGLEKSGVRVLLGVDLDPDCEYPYEANNRARFLLKSVETLSGKELLAAKNRKKDFLLLAGCAPCQPFSGYRKGIKSSSDKRWRLLREFRRLIEETKPEFVTMENVPRLQGEAVFREFVQALSRSGYHVSFSIVRCADYGIPQQRQRLVLLASKLGPIGLIPPTHPPRKHRTVADAIAGLPRIRAGESCSKDPLHYSASLSPVNRKRIISSRPGGTWRDWDTDLVSNCHKKATGKTYPSVYGRMNWEQPAPTMTTQFFGFGNGRFGHPEQHRAISIREGAILQSFPKNYKFIRKGDEVSFKRLGRLIGNAVPVRLGEVIGRTIVQHVENMNRKRTIQYRDKKIEYR